jgi:arginine deiminase
LTHTGVIDTDTNPARNDWMPNSRMQHGVSSVVRSRRADAPVVMPVEWGIDSEVGRLREVVLCAPDHWAIDKNANAVTRAAVVKGVDFDLGTAKRQHRDFAAVFQREGVGVRWLPQLPSQISQTYTRDSSFMTPWGAVVTLMQADVRKGESAAVIEFCRTHNVPIWNQVSAGTLEGGDVHVAKPGKILVGYSEGRTTRSGALQVVHWFAQKGWAGKLIYIDAHFLHLDLLFCMVDAETAVICTDVLADSKVDEIVNFLEIKTVIRTTYKQAMALVGNVLSLGDRKVIVREHRENAGLIEQLVRHRFLPLPVDLSSFCLDGGGPHCLAMPYCRDLLAGSTA